MEFTEEQKLLFLQDKPFYENDNCFCLGNSLEEAGEIVKQIVNKKKEKLECGNGYYKN